MMVITLKSDFLFNNDITKRYEESGIFMSSRISRETRN